MVCQNCMTYNGHGTFFETAETLKKWYVRWQGRPTRSAAGPNRSADLLPAAAGSAQARAPSR